MKLFNTLLAALLLVSTGALAQTVARDGTVVTAPTGSLTTPAGTFTWGALHSGTPGEYEILLNGVDTTGYATTIENSCIAGVDQSVVAYSNVTTSWWEFVSGTLWVAAPVPNGSACPSAALNLTISAASGGGGAPTNSITLTNPTATTVTNYPYQFGRPFTDGAIQHSPMVLVNGTAVPSQSDVKNRYPDGSVEFAVVSAIVPTIQPTACDLVNTNPAEMPPYALWAAHGNSPVFNTPYYHSAAPSTVNVLQGPCDQFDGPTPKSMITMHNLSAQSQIGGEWGLTEVPPTYSIVAGTMFSSMVCSGTSWCPAAAGQVGVGCDEETGCIWGYVSATANNGDAVDVVTDSGGATATVYSNGVQVATGPTTEPINTAGEYALGADGDHVYNGPIIAFDQIITNQVLAAAQVATISAQFQTFYATPGSVAPIVCSTPGLTCKTAISFTQQLVAGATKPYKLYRVSDGATQDGRFTANGNVDTAYDLAFCGTVANCKWTKAYDQVGEVNTIQQAVLTFADTTVTSTPMTTAQMEAALPVGQAYMTLTPTTGAAVTVDAGQMLLDGNCQPWTQGAVAQTMFCGDDTATAKYDVGFDSYKPFRPHFYATFWNTGQVYVRALGENDKATQLEDISYTLALPGGYTKALNGTYSAGGYNLVDWANSWWTKTFWVGTAPPQAVNIDNNLAYLDYTHFFPNMDTTISILPSDLYNAYNGLMGAPHDIYDGDWDGQYGPLAWQTAQGDEGDSTHIGPYPGQEEMWLHSPDWRARSIATTQADISVAWNSMFRESDPTRNLNRGDTGGTGLGLPISVVGRPGWVDGATTDYPTWVGTASSNPWQGTTDHQPAPYYPLYIATGDKFYLDAMQFVANYSVFRNGAASPYVCTNQTSTCSDWRGPTGAYGGLFGFSNNRDDAWTIRGRGEAAFASVDGTPEKKYLTVMMNDAIAKYEGNLGITGTPFDTATVKTWVESTSFPNDNCNSARAGQNLGNGVSPLGLINCVDVAGAGILPGQGPVIGTDATYDEMWYDAYSMYSFARVIDLGFVGWKPMLANSSKVTLGILSSTYPWLLAQYETGVSNVGTGAFYPTWANYLATSTDPTTLAGLKSNWASDWESTDGNTPREIYYTPGLAAMVDAGTPGASAAWSWLNTNGYSLGQSVGAFNNFRRARWAIVPRPAYDTVVLPPQSTQELP